ncbi:MAG TPA: TonB-dependent receptor, partial [Vicinamibacterales bacterium]|nr:TonB-dependent receptor [Vicinamibacterales bacterium]
RAGGGYGRVALTWDRLSIAPGVRVDRWLATSSTAVSPWVIATLRVTSSTDITAGISRQTQFADLDQIFGLQAGGPGLRPERARHVDVALVQRLPHALSLELSAFDRRETGLLATPEAEPRRIGDVVMLGRGDDRWRNVRSGEARGIEALLRRDSAAGLSGWIGYAFGDHTQADAGGPAFAADFDQRHAVSAFARYPLSNRMAIGAKVRYGTNYPLTGFIAPQAAMPNQRPLLGGGVPLFYTLTDARNTQRLPSYFRVDLRLDRTFTWGSRRATLFAEVANATDRANMRNTPYSVDRLGRVFDPMGTLLPIIPSAGLLIEF